MTTGPEHYREAERELDAFGLVSADLKGLDLLAVTKMHAAMARAQVHATLALAAATANLPIDLGEDATEDWRAAVS
jgi:hypothetical protein